MLYILIQNIVIYLHICLSIYQNINEQHFLLLCFQYSYNVCIHIQSSNNNVPCSRDFRIAHVLGWSFQILRPCTTTPFVKLITFKEVRIKTVLAESRTNEFIKKLTAQNHSCVFTAGKVCSDGFYFNSFNRRKRGSK